MAGGLTGGHRLAKEALHHNSAPYLAKCSELIEGFGAALPTETAMKPAKKLIEVALSLYLSMSGKWSDA